MMFKEGNKMKIKATGKVGSVIDQNGHAAKIKVPGEEYCKWFHKDELLPAKDKGDKGKGKGKEGKGKGKGKGKDFYTQWSGPTSAGSGYRLNVKNLPESHATEAKLKELFKPYGVVSEAQVKTRYDGSSRGIGYVVLKNEKQGNKAMQELNGKEIDGKQLDVGPAERRDDGKGKGKGKAATTEQMYAASYMAYMAAMQ